MESTDIRTDLETPMWRRQCARNLMDCYAAGMAALAGRPGDKGLERLTQLMVEGMTAVREAEDEKAFYRLAAGLCRECEQVSGLFRIYAALFEELGREGIHEEPNQK